MEVEYPKLQEIYKDAFFQRYLSRLSSTFGLWEPILKEVIKIFQVKPEETKRIFMYYQPELNDKDPGMRMIEFLIGSLCHTEAVLANAFKITKKIVSSCDSHNDYETPVYQFELMSKEAILKSLDGAWVWNNQETIRKFMDSDYEPYLRLCQVSNLFPIRGEIEKC